MASERAIVVGAGGISNPWFKALNAEGVTVSAVVDLNLAAAQKQIAAYELADAKASTDLGKTLAETPADFVIDLTVPEAHAAVTCAALEAGLPVVSEKPMADSLANARRMVETSERTGKLYMVSQSRRWDTNHATLAASARGGVIGPLTTLNCDFYLGAHFGGFRDEMASVLILDMAIHHFDMARMICGKDPLSVYAEEFNPAGSWYQGCAAGVCLFDMTDGVKFHYRGSWCAEGCHTSWNGHWRVIGERGTLLYEKDQMPFGEVVAQDEGFTRPKEPARILETPIAKSAMHGGLNEMLQYLRTGQVPQTECHDNIKSLAMVFAAIESSATGKRVPVQA